MIDEDLGYYLCDGIKFTSKVNALIYSSTNKKPVEWIFHNDIFSSYRWDIEPEHDLDYYYDKRAKELREKYDYIVLSYSGGSDTHNILESFLRQGLHIDEIVTNHITSATKSATVLNKNIKQSWNFAAEHELNAVEKLDYIRKVSPKTKITVLDVSDLVLNSIIKFDDVNWVLNRNDHLSIGQLFRYNYFHFSNIKKQLDKNFNKVAIIVGLDKPKTAIHDNKFYTSFIDTTVNITTINEFNSDYDNVKVELFYWSKDCLDLLAKQAHVIKRHIEDNPKLYNYWKFKVKIKDKVYLVTDMNRILHEKLLRNIIYTTWNDEWFQVDKSIFWWNTEFDTWFRQSNDPKLYKQRILWKRGIDYLLSLVPEYVEYKENVPDKLKVFKHKYCLGEMNMKIDIGENNV